MSERVRIIVRKFIVSEEEIKTYRGEYHKKTRGISGGVVKSKPVLVPGGEYESKIVK